MKKSILLFLFIMLLAVLPLSSQEEEYDEDLFDLPDDFEIEEETETAVTEEAFSIYGYIVNYFNINFNFSGYDFEDADFGNVIYLRLKGDWNPGEHLSFHAELSYDAKIGNQNSLIFFESAGLPPIALIDQSMFPLDDFIQTLNIDHFWGSVSFWRIDVQFGKMPIAWGTGYFFNPTQRVSLASFMDTVIEETPGTYGIAPSISIIDELAIQGYVAFQDKSHKLTALSGDADWENLPYGIKIQAILGSFDVSLSWIHEVLYSQTLSAYKHSYYVGIDFAGAIWDFGVYGEAVMNLPFSGVMELDFDRYEFMDLFEFCLGFDYTIPLIEVDTRVEYYHQGSGERDKNNYDIYKVLGSEQILQAEDYLLLFVEKIFLDYYSISVIGFINLNDGSVAVLPIFSYDMYSNFQVALGSGLFFGPQGSEFSGDYAPGVDLTQPSLFVRAKLSF